MKGGLSFYPQIKRNFLNYTLVSFCFVRHCPSSITLNVSCEKPDLKWLHLNPCEGIFLQFWQKFFLGKNQEQKDLKWRHILNMILPSLMKVR